MRSSPAARHEVLRLRPGAALVAIPTLDDGEEVTYVYVADESLPEANAQERLNTIRELGGAWSDLDWDETVESLDRIRHESIPTPPIDDL